MPKTLVTMSVALKAIRRPKTSLPMPQTELPMQRPKKTALVV